MNVSSQGQISRQASIKFCRIIAGVMSEKIYPKVIFRSFFSLKVYHPRKRWWWKTNVRTKKECWSYFINAGKYRSRRESQMIENCGVTFATLPRLLLLFFHPTCACEHLQRFIKRSEIEPLHRHTLETETDSCSVRVISSAIRHQQTNMLRGSHC